MTGRNERFTPEEAARFRLKSYRLQFGEESIYSICRILTKDSSAHRCGCILYGPRRRKDPLPGGQRVLLDHVGRMAYPLRSDDGAQNRSLPGRVTEAWQKLVKECAELKLSGICAKCPDRKLCHACAAMAEAETGSPSGIPTYLWQTVIALKKLAGKNWPE